MSGASINSAMDAAYYVDKQTGFVPRQMTLQGLPEPWDIWEATLDGFKRGALMHNDSVQFLDSDQRAREELKAKAWRRAIEEVGNRISFIYSLLIIVSRCQHCAQKVLRDAKDISEGLTMSWLSSFRSTHIRSPQQILLSFPGRCVFLFFGCLRCTTTPLLSLT